MIKVYWKLKTWLDLSVGATIMTVNCTTCDSWGDHHDSKLYNLWQSLHCIPPQSCTWVGAFDKGINYLDQTSFFFFLCKVLISDDFACRPPPKSAKMNNSQQNKCHVYYVKPCVILEVFFVRLCFKTSFKFWKHLIEGYGPHTVYNIQLCSFYLFLAGRPQPG